MNSKPIMNFRVSPELQEVVRKDWPSSLPLTPSEVLRASLSTALVAPHRSLFAQGFVDLRQYQAFGVQHSNREGSMQILFQIVTLEPTQNHTPLDLLKAARIL